MDMISFQFSVFSFRLKKISFILEAHAIFLSSLCVLRVSAVNFCAHINRRDAESAEETRRNPGFFYPRPQALLGNADFPSKFCLDTTFFSLSPRREASSSPLH
ncbi:MAG: hypothetical protein C4567_09190 [Deltaproteobacteria bacterium]|nr:MAG: hypothetical protein C4567_09190 [Deltaproteobacteria bacterium]